jgi:nitroimidazol reductase NimA-like FMN-containing flavoprotein (pyridoxamine 5'-phosphate oxidase superfamily)
MTEFRGAWSESDVEAFLREATIPIRIATHRPDDTLWPVALWYRYRDGALECATGASADVVGFLRHDPEIAFDVSTNEIPYRGVRGTGTATVSPDDDKTALRALVERYLGDTNSGLAEWLLDDDRDEVRIRIEPRTIYSWDYADRMRGSATDTAE